MNSTSPLRKLLRPPSVTDQLNLFRLLFESSEINTDLALALLKVIHKELGTDQVADRSAYKTYAGTIETLRYYRSEMLKQVVDSWNRSKAARDPEWLSDGTIK